MLDCTTEIAEEEKTILSELHKYNHIIVINKIDINNEYGEIGGAVRISALKSQGLDILGERILEQLGFPEDIENIALPLYPFDDAMIESLRVPEKLSDAEINDLKVKLEKVKEITRITML